jgi:hypothetical protein
MKTRLIILAAALAASLPAAAMAQDGGAQQGGAQQEAQQGGLPPGVDPATFQRDMQAAAQYPLPQDFLPRMTATIRALEAAHIAPPSGPNLSLAQTIERTGAVPGLRPILAAHGFTPRDFVLGITTFGLTEALIQQPPPPGAHVPTPNPANVALIRNDPQNAQALMQVIGGPGQQQQ